MNRYTMGWTIFVTMFGMMCISLGNDIKELKDANELYTVSFVGSALVHLGTVIGAFVGGKIMPENRNPKKRTRLGDE